MSSVGFKWLLTSWSPRVNFPQVLGFQRSPFVKILAGVRGHERSLDIDSFATFRNGVHFAGQIFRSLFVSWGRTASLFLQLEMREAEFFNSSENQEMSVSKTVHIISSIQSRRALRGAIRAITTVAALSFSAASFAAGSNSALTTMYSFDGPSGNWPLTLIQGADSNFYGVTNSGGLVNSSCPTGCGTAFSITPNGAESVIHAFDESAGLPTVITKASSGLFYGATTNGLFSLSAGGDFQPLQSPLPSSTGYWPVALVEGADGNLYGATQMGGTGDISVCLAGCGAVFQLTPQGALTTLYQFQGAQDGGEPSGPLIQGIDGDFYGVAASGGNFKIQSAGDGTIFKISASGQFQVLHTFSGRDGAMPSGRLIQTDDGTIYGTTLRGGHSFGTVYKLASDGTLTVLHVFSWSDGSRPYALILGRDGKLYGVTNTGGANGSGVLFQISTSGQYSVLADFSRNAGGSGPAAIVQGTDGMLYGVAAGGGANNMGTVWRYPLAQ